MPHCRRKLLFDFGTSYFSTSLKWLLDTYGKAGIQVCSLRVHLLRGGLDQHEFLGGRGLPLARNTHAPCAAIQRVPVATKTIVFAPSPTLCPPTLVQFDEMWAWEVKLFEPERYWSEVPAHVKPSLHVRLQCTVFADLVQPLPPLMLSLLLPCCCCCPCCAAAAPVLLLCPSCCCPCCCCPCCPCFCCCVCLKRTCTAIC